MESTLIIIIKLMGGLGLLIYGMKLMGDGLENVAGEGLKRILEKITSNPIISVTVGAVVSAVIQSSSSTTVMVVGLVNAGLMNLVQATGVIMGANIGATMTAQLVSFKLGEIVPLFIFAGAGMVMFARGKKRREIGNVVLGFGIIFTGMGIMSNSMVPLTTSPVFEQLIITIGDNWFMGIMVGAVITAVLQSSSATTGILVAVATAGAIDIRIVLPIICGCNIGTCVTAIIASLGANKNGKKAAAIHLIFNIVGTIIFIPFLGGLGDFVVSISGSVTRQIANAHTVFSIVNTMIMLPFSKYLIMAVNKIIPGEDEFEKTGSKYIEDRLLETPVIAAGQVIKETIRMANKAKVNLELSINAFTSEDENLVKKVYENEEMINVLEQAITTFLVKLSKCDLSDKETDIIASTFYVVMDIEKIGGHAENIAELAAQKNSKQLIYSTGAIQDLYEIYNYTMTALQVAIESYSDRNCEKARSIDSIQARIDAAQKKFKEKHIKRLYDEKCNAYAGAIFLDLIINLERIGNHSTNIAKSVIENYSN